MRVGLECSLLKRAREKAELLWGIGVAASIRTQIVPFKSITSSNACALNTIPAFVQVANGKVTASFEWSLHTKASFTVP